MQSAPSQESLLSGSGAPTAKFPTKGTNYQGDVIDAQVTQQRDFDTQKPAFWDDGSPKWQLVVTIQTDERDPDIEDDDGTRRIFCKFKLLDAVKAAVKEAGEKAVLPGGWISVTYSGNEKRVGNKQPTKLYTVEYEPPEPGADQAAVFDDDEPAPPPRGAAKAAPAKATGRRRAAEPAPAQRGRRAPKPADDDDFEEGGEAF